MISKNSKLFFILVYLTIIKIEKFSPFAFFFEILSRFKDFNIK